MNNFSSMKRLFWNSFWVLVACALVALPIVESVAQQQTLGAPTTSRKSKAPFTLTIKKGPVTGLALRAKNAKLSEITAELAKQLQVPVFLSPVMENQVVSVDFTDLALEPALQLLAPQVFVDYQVNMMEQVPLGIYLSGYNEPQPATNAVVPSSSQAILVEGDTEDGVEPTTEEARKKLEEKPLRVSLLNNNLTIRAKKQPLTLIVLKVGEELGIPVELRDEPRDVITTDIVSVPWEDAIQRLSPNIRLYVRADLMRLERRLLRMVLMAPASESQTSVRSQ